MQTTSLQSFYNTLWKDAVDSFSQGDIQLDPHLLNRQDDQRLGLSVVIRPQEPVKSRMVQIIEQLRGQEPFQHYYTRDELHVTVLSLFSATEAYARYMPNIPIYRDVLQSVCLETPSFQIRFTGITATNSAVMVQGFPEQDALNAFRERLREALRAAGVGDSLDTRYRIITAHITIMRFQAQPHNLKGFLDTLRTLREYDFGMMTVNTVQWVKNDWYMSSDKVELLKEFAFSNHKDHNVF